MAAMSTPAELEMWVREELRLDEAQAVDITEMPGNDPRCSPVVTVVAIGGTAGTVAIGAAPGAEPYAFHIERALDEVVRMDVIAALAFGGH